MKKISLLLIALSTAAGAQQKKAFDDVLPNLEARIIAVQPIGNNALAKNMKIFYGVGLGASLMTPIKFGIGVDYNSYISNVKGGQEHFLGEIGSPKMTNVDLYLIRKMTLSNSFELEASAGFSYFNVSYYFTEGDKERFHETGTGFNVSAKFLHTLDREGRQQLFLSPKLQFYSTDKYNDYQVDQDFYGRTAFIGLSAGYRYNF